MSQNRTWDSSNGIEVHLKSFGIKHEAIYIEFRAVLHTANCQYYPRSTLLLYAPLISLETLQRESDPCKLIKMLLRFEHYCTSFMGLIKLDIFYKKDPYFLKKTNYLTRYSDKKGGFRDS